MKKLSECTVLVVDDMETNIDILVEAFGDDYDVSVAMDGESALENIEIEIPDIILLDIMMPGMDGYEVCRRIKANEALKDIPIIFLTAITDISSKTKGFELGAVDYITKPFEILEVKARVFTHLSLRLAQYELAEKNRILEERTEELKNVNCELKAFSYTVSHDLKSPLRVIEGYSKIIIEDNGEMLNKDGKEMLSRIKNTCSSMITMIEKMLEYSVTASKEIHKENLNIGEMFNSVFTEVSLVYPQRVINFEFETGMPPVSGDVIMIKQVIYNVVSNAVKFTKNTEKARIITGCKRGANEYIFYIRDNGAGIDMEYSSKLFSMFQRLHSKDEFEGNGIGLATVHKIIQRHGGRTWIEGKVNEGTTVYFTLPCA